MSDEPSSSLLRIVARRFSEKLPDGEKRQPRVGPLADFRCEGALVVLGEPGSGKTTAFEEAARNDSDAIYASAADFLCLSLDRYRDKTLFIDGLDEQRALSRSGSVFDEIRGRLDELGRPRFRISCRTADWYGPADASALARIAPGGAVTALHLEPLSLDDVCEAIRDNIPDTANFLKQAARFGVEDLLTNPQTLGMLLTVVLDKGRWPSSKAKLYEEATKVLGREHSEVHAHDEHGRIGLEAVREAAGRLCAILLCGGSQGFALSAPAEAPGFPYIRNILGDEPKFEAVLRRRLFKSAGIERAAPAHRTIAEYLAAKFLAGLITGGFPLSRVLALVKTGHGIPANLRGLFAWLACLCPTKAEALIAEDPLAVVLQGDVGLLSPSQKIMIFREFERLSTRDPYYRAGIWDGHRFGALACPELVPFVKASLRRAAEMDATSLICVIDAISYGEIQTNLGDELLVLIGDGSIGAHIRDRALDAFIRACPARTNELLPLLDRINRGEIEDEKQELRGTLLENLYPRVVSPSQLANYIVKPDPNYIGTYYMLLSRRFVAETPANHLSTLLDSVLATDFDDQWKRELFWRNFIGGLLLRTLQTAGDRASPEKLFKWLGVPLDKHGYANVRTDEHRAIREWLQARPDKVKALFEVWLSMGHDDHPRGDFWQFMNYRLAGARLSADFARWLLQRAALTSSGSRTGSFLFALAASFVFNGQGDSTLDDLIAFVAEHSEFAGQFESMRSCPIDENHFAHHAQMQKWENERTIERCEYKKWLTENLVPIRSGRHWGALLNLANIYFGHFADSGRKDSPSERLTSTTNDEITKAALEGFKAATLKEFPELTPGSIGRTRARGKSYGACYVILAGMDQVSAGNAEDFGNIPETTLKLAVVFHFDSAHGDYDDSWLTRLIENRPAFVASALFEYFDIQFRTLKKKEVSRLYHLCQDNRLAAVARELVPRFLRQYPDSHPKTLETLFHAGLKHCPHGELAEIAEEVLGRRPALRGICRVQWLALLLMLRPEKAAARLTRLIGKSKERSLALLDVFHIPSSYNDRIEVPVFMQTLLTCIQICGRSFPPSQHHRSGFVHRHDDAQSQVGGFITLLSNDDSAEATSALQTLLDDRTLAAWKDQLLHALAIQRRKRCDAEYRAPSAEQIARALSSGQPASVADFQALLCEALDSIRDRIRNSSTDGWEAFWNTKGRTPKSENECRNRLKELLDAELGRIGVNCEPESLYAEIKRADLKAMCGEWSIPIEIKRHYHRELWTAPTKQLAVRYARDPAAHRHGIYVVFYFGHVLTGIPKPPASTKPPRTAAELEDALFASLPADWRETLCVKVIDVSLPPRSSGGSSTRRKKRSGR